MPPGNSLTELEHWHVDPADPSRVFPALAHLLPDGFSIGLWNGGAAEPALGALRVDPTALPLARCPEDFFHAAWYRATPEALATLAELCRSHAAPELFIHVFAAGPDGSLLEWWDAPDDPLALAGWLPQRAVAAFARACAAGYRRAPAGS
jgi:hypothetical protein